MAKTTGLSKPMIEALTLLAQGDAEIREDWLGSTRIAKIGSMPFSQRRVIHNLTLQSLEDRGLVKKTGYRYPDHIYQITEAGRRAVAAPAAE